MSSLFNHQDWKALWGEEALRKDVGVVYTKPEVVRTILDLVGYTPDQPLAEKRILEPGCGQGAFLEEIVDRLIQSIRQHMSASSLDWTRPQWDQAIRALDIDQEAVRVSRRRVRDKLTENGAPSQRAKQLAQTWICQGDFLLASGMSSEFDFVVGNPPYVAARELPQKVQDVYRQNYTTMTGQADLYIPFFERGLKMLNNTGVLGFICANRFTKNQYGEPLRRLIARYYHVRCYLNLEQAEAFTGDVDAYPGIFVITSANQQHTWAGEIENVEKNSWLQVVRDVGADAPSLLERHDDWYTGSSAWISTTPDDREFWVALQEQFPTLEKSGHGTKVGIGVATGADDVFILEEKNSQIEEERQLPLALASDITNQGLEWGEHYLVNPYEEEGLVSLDQWPGFAAYIAQHEEAIKGRYIARQNPQSWYRTIDRVWPALQKQKKLFIPDIKGETTIALDDGEYYPQHNLYYITSGEWELRALKTLLRSSYVFRQIRLLSTKLRGGYPRYQASTLRKVRLPHRKTLSEELIVRLQEVSDVSEQAIIDQICRPAFPEFLL